MLAALLLNEPYPGGFGKSHDEEKADRYLKTLRKEHFERQRVKDLEQTADQEVKRIATVTPVPPKIEETIETSDNLRLVTDEDGDALALLLIISQL